MSGVKGVVRRRRMPMSTSVDTAVVDNRAKTRRQVTRKEATAVGTKDVLTPAHITVQGKITKNLGDYNSAQVCVGITRPCKDTAKEIERVYAECSVWVDTKIREELEKV